MRTRGLRALLTAMLVGATLVLGASTPAQSQSGTAGEICLYNDINFGASSICQIEVRSELDTWKEVFRLSGPGYDFNNVASSITLGGRQADVKCEAFVWQKIDFGGYSKRLIPRNDHYEGWYFENDLDDLTNFVWPGSTLNMNDTISGMELHCWSIL